MEETRMRGATLLCKVFLQHLSPLLTLPTFMALWLTVLEFMDKYMHADGSDLLEDPASSCEGILLARPYRLESTEIFCTRNWSYVGGYIYTMSICTTIWSKACGFEILASSAQKKMQVRKGDAEHDFCNDIQWRRFAKSLKDKGYFRAEVEGSRMYNTLMLQAKEFYLSSLNRGTATSSSPGVRVQKLLKTVNANYEEMKKAEKSLRPPDDDSWMDITPEIFDSMLEKMSHQPTEATVAKTLTSGLKSFVHKHSDIEGVEPPVGNPKNKKQKINFDPDAFTDAVNKILDFRIPHSDDDESSSSMSGYSDDDDDDVTLGEGSRVLKELPSAASIEEETGPLSDINEEDDDFRPVDVNLTALKNLESYSSQQGLPGPVSNLFSSWAWKFRTIWILEYISYKDVTYLISVSLLLHSLQLLFCYTIPFRVRVEQLTSILCFEILKFACCRNRPII
ncbi:Golgi-specific brefeldin A-resistance guanine nucleotide exchange factor 1 [Araneus ventricosus]|uniref:Golgi-specific brefeldin A-resistance guanine nucleotide exchange factor 1 n=1 Tax=Araneus ventricosus TaxID=182803 RepID=A0A4Y2JPS1_ARAVE|nr:Golgi-specific brefeldin A-resistance guanine nucleotide exchange factor 1 [Araneus ventricosus]